MSKDIFLSHSSEDKETARAICAGLEDWGLDVWIAPRDIPGGKEWGEAIVHGIESCHGVVFLSSRHAYQSDHTTRELNLADSANKPIVPVRLDETELPSRFRYLLAHIQWIDTGRSPTEDDYETIARAVDEVCPDVTIEPPGDNSDDSGLAESIRKLDEKRDFVADQLSTVLRNHIGDVPIDLERYSREFVDDLQCTLEELEHGYVVEFYGDSDMNVRIAGQDQSAAMRKATDYLIQNHDLTERVESIPWVPGRTKAIINDTTEWEEADPKYDELESGYYLDTKLSKKGKQRELRRMADRCDLSIDFYGKW